MRFRFYILTTLTVHFIGAMVIGFCTMGLGRGFLGGFMYATLGFPVLFIEFPIVSLALISLKKSNSKISRISITFIGLILSCIFPIRAILLDQINSFQLSGAIAIPLGAIIILLADQQRRANCVAEQDAAPNRYPA